MPPPERMKAYCLKPRLRRRSPTASRASPVAAPSATRTLGPIHWLSNASLRVNPTVNTTAMMPAQANQTPPMSDSRSRRFTSRFAPALVSTPFGAVPSSAEAPGACPAVSPEAATASVAAARRSSSCGARAPSAAAPPGSVA